MHGFGPPVTATGGATTAPSSPRCHCRLTFAAFLRLLALVADKKGVPLAQVVGAAAGLQGPAASGATEPEYVRLHDDRSLYTGGRGGVPVGERQRCLPLPFSSICAPSRATEPSTSAPSHCPADALPSFLAHPAQACMRGAG